MLRAAALASLPFLLACAPDARVDGGAADSGGAGGGASGATGGVGGASSSAGHGGGGQAGAGAACPTAICDGMCVDLATDSDHCNGCGQACTAPTGCFGSACTSPAPLENGRGDHGVATGGDGRIHVIGGYPSDLTLWSYSPQTNSWQTSALPLNRRGVAAAADPAGRVYMFGGYNPGEFEPQGEASVYDPDSGSWAPIAPMYTPRKWMAATTGADGRIYAIGGWGGAGDEVEAYDPQTDSWTAITRMPTPRERVAAATAHDGRIFVFGGRGPSEPCGPNTCPTVSDVVEVYDPQTHSWDTAASMPTARQAAMAVTSSEGLIYVIAGQYFGTEGAATKFHSLGSVEIYDPAFDSWTSLDDIQRTEEAAATLGPDGRIYVVGGSDGTAALYTALGVLETDANVWLE